MIYVFDYATLKLIWWLLVGLLLVGFAILDGMDLGARTSRKSRQADRFFANAIIPVTETHSAAQHHHLTLHRQNEALQRQATGLSGTNRQLHRELVSFMIEKPTTITRCLNLMVISKCIERIADHAKSIAEEVVFLYEARDIRHQAVITRQP